jgi:DNA-binding XRE family transcriptional regulator
MLSLTHSSKLRKYRTYYPERDLAKSGALHRAVNAYDHLAYFYGMKRFGGKLRTLRKRDGLTQQQLGARLGVRQAYIAQLEKGQKIPNALLLIKLAALFNVTTDQLMLDKLELD